MAKAFARKGSGDSARFVATLDEFERGLVAGLLRQVRDALAPDPAQQPAGDEFDALVASLGSGEPIEPPDDPVLRRLLPDGTRDDPQAAGEYRRLTEHGLRQRKTQRLELAADALEREPSGDGAADPDRVDLDRAEAEALVVGLTDVRLTLGEILGLRTDEDADALHRLSEGPADTADPRLQAVAYYDFLTWLQESLTLALMPPRWSRGQRRQTGGG